MKKLSPGISVKSRLLLDSLCNYNSDCKSSDFSLKNVLLMIAYHFRPLVGSSGIQRTLRFAGHLPKFGWKPDRLSLRNSRAYEQVSDDFADEVPEGLSVIRAPAWDTARHLSIHQRYLGLLARPDRWISWWFGAVPMGLRPSAAIGPTPSGRPIPLPPHIASVTALRNIPDFPGSLTSAIPWPRTITRPIPQWRSFSVSSGPRLHARI
ncbi:MAG: hypothetical protein MZV65_28220 [Chromatiales bacterium]|nr:hypothetical protein [Chromatiales bacterium]